jgi:uncharacterized protein DUF4307
VTHPAPDLAERYGAPSRHRRPLLVAGVALLAAAGVAWVVWVSVFHSRPEVTSELVGFEVAGQHTATATFTVVRRDADVRASCLLRAVAADHAVVGELTVAVDSGPASSSVRSTVRTERRATSVDLVGCIAPDQSRRR